MKHSIILILCMASVMQCCSQGLPKIHVQTETVQEVNGKNQSKSVYEDVKSAYFEIGLYSAAGEKFYMAMKKIKKPRIGEPYNSVELYIVGEDKKVIHFESTTQFLNWMDARGYEMVDQTKEKYVTHYTFKRKA